MGRRRRRPKQTQMAGPGFVVGVSHYKLQADERATPLCPLCGREAQERLTKYGIRAECCGLWSWDRHPLADARTHAARQAAHRVFDELWRGGRMTREEAYLRVARELNLSRRQFHMKLLEYEDAVRVPIAVAAVVADLEYREPILIE